MTKTWKSWKFLLFTEEFIISKASLQCLQQEISWWTICFHVSPGLLIAFIWQENDKYDKLGQSSSSTLDWHHPVHRDLPLLGEYFHIATFMGDTSQLCCTYFKTSRLRHQSICWDCMTLQNASKDCAVWKPYIKFVKKIISPYRQTMLSWHFLQCFATNVQQIHVPAQKSVLQERCMHEIETARAITKTVCGIPSVYKAKLAVWIITIYWGIGW